jgi:tetratricopeptide (TPR) repeat protein
MTTKYIIVMNRFLLALALCLFSIALAKAQNLDEETEFIYIKANYLLDTERYEDAIKEFTKIVNDKGDYKEALLLRAKAKYAMAAYQGTKKDVLLYLGTNGASELALILLGKADYKMGNNDAALNSLTIAAMVNKEDAQISEFIGNIYEEKEQLLKACEFWQKSAKMGSSRSRIKAKNVCGSIVGDLDEVEESTPEKTEDMSMEDGNTSENDDEVKNESTATEMHKDDTLNNPTKDKVLQQKQENEEETQEDKNNYPQEDEASAEEETDSPKVEKQPENLPEEDNTPNEIVIDEDLTLIIRGQGLGKRRILDQPNILILSDEDGIVGIDICVNKRGKVETAEFNSKLSTIAKKSLVSLAIRKSKDFWFEKNDYKEQCGVIMFKIKGS